MVLAGSHIDDVMEQASLLVGKVHQLRDHIGLALIHRPAILAISGDAPGVHIAVGL